MSAVPVALRPARTDHVQRARVGFRGRPPCAPPERRRPQVQWRGDCRGCGGQRLGRPASGMRERSPARERHGTGVPSSAGCRRLGFRAWRRVPPTRPSCATAQSALPQ